MLITVLPVERQVSQRGSRGGPWFRGLIDRSGPPGCGRLGSGSEAETLAEARERTAGACGDGARVFPPWVLRTAPACRGASDPTLSGLASPAVVWVARNSFLLSLPASTQAAVQPFILEDLLTAHTTRVPGLEPWWVSQAGLPYVANRGEEWTEVFGVLKRRLRKTENDFGISKLVVQSSFFSESSYSLEENLS